MIRSEKLRRRFLVILIACAVVFAAACKNSVQARQATAADHFWKNYTNVRFQYKICYPADLLVAQGESENSDGQTFLAKDGAKLIVYGQNNALNDSLKDTLQDTASRLAGSSGKVTYQVLKPSWFVVSGRNDGSIFYAKTLYANHQFKSFELTYEDSQSGVYGPLVKRLSACFADLAH